MKQEDVSYKSYKSCRILRNPINLKYFQNLFSAGFTVWAHVRNRCVQFFILFQRKQLCTVRNSILVIVAELFVALGLYSFSVWTISVTYATNGQAYCTGLQPQYLHLYKIMINIDTLITLIIPSCAIFLFNIRIIYAMVKTAKRRHCLGKHISLTRAESLRNGMKLSDSSTHNQAKRCLKGAVTRPELKTTRLLIIISTVFIVLNCPSHAIRVYESGKRLNDPNYTSSQTMIRVQELAQFFYYLKNSSSKKTERVPEHEASSVKKCSWDHSVSCLTHRSVLHDLDNLVQ